jgi:hypothetical protein
VHREKDRVEFLLPASPRAFSHCEVIALLSRACLIQRIWRSAPVITIPHSTLACPMHKWIHIDKGLLETLHIDRRMTEEQAI